MTDLTDHFARLESDGYTLVEDAVTPDICRTLLDRLTDLERTLDIRPAGNRFEGAATTRVYNLLARGPEWQQIPVAEPMLSLVGGVLGPDPLVSSLSSINIAPGEIAQPIHADDQLHAMPKPHPATVCNTMWALTDFTEANGATRIIPGSHTRDHAPPYGEPQDSIAAEMPAGSVLVWHGSLWHGGGANTTDEHRVGIAMNYCAGWVRQQENQQLGIDTETVASFSPRLRALCGFGVYNGLVGHIDRHSPAELLYGDPPITNVWDAADRRPSVGR